MKIKRPNKYHYRCKACTGVAHDLKRTADCPLCHVSGQGELILSNLLPRGELLLLDNDITPITDSNIKETV